MRNYDEEEAASLNAQPWQTDLLKLNPGYTSWGPHEEYMCGDKKGLDARQLFKTWSEFGPWHLDELNECVNFYFSVRRASEECDACGGNGYHRDAQQVVNTFYAHMNPDGEHWNDKITQDEVDALWAKGRLTFVRKDKSKPSVDEVNAVNKLGGMSGHDAINRMILTEARLKRMGLPVTCDKCEGHGHVFTEPDSHVSLTLWMLHPRKGFSRGVEVEIVTESDLPDVFNWLREARDRNAERFSKIPDNLQS